MAASADRSTTINEQRAARDKRAVGLVNYSPSKARWIDTPDECDIEKKTTYRPREPTDAIRSRSTDRARAPTKFKRFRVRNTKNELGERGREQSTRIEIFGSGREIRPSSFRGGFVIFNFAPPNRNHSALLLGIGNTIDRLERIFNCFDCLVPNCKNVAANLVVYSFLLLITTVWVYANKPFIGAQLLSEAPPLTGSNTFFFTWLFVSFCFYFFQAPTVRIPSLPGKK